MKTTYRKKKFNPADLTSLPRLDVINVIQFQLFDNGEKPGRGRSRHQLKLEVYCDGRLDLMNPYWVRVVPLLAEKTFITWVDKALQEGKITQVQYETYQIIHETIVKQDANPDIEFAKLGHIGCKAKNEYYPGQFVAVVKEKGGSLTVYVVRDGVHLETDSFLFDQTWFKGSSRRKFFGFYDPAGMYESAKREREFAAKAEGRSLS